jgi:hypothetical protein
LEKRIDQKDDADEDMEDMWAEGRRIAMLITTR